MVMLMQRGWTALMFAALQGDEDITDMLIKYNADVMMKEKQVSFIGEIVI